MHSRCICVAIVASISINFWPSVVPLSSLRHLRLLSRLPSPSRLNGCKYFCALRFLSEWHNITSFLHAQPGFFIRYTQEIQGELTILHNFRLVITTCSR